MLTDSVGVGLLNILRRLCLLALVGVNSKDVEEVSSPEESYIYNKTCCIIISKLI